MASPDSAAKSAAASATSAAASAQAAATALEQSVETVAGRSAASQTYNIENDAGVQGALATFVGVVEPSGDTTGVTDTANIQAREDAGLDTNLVTGATYYVKGLVKKSNCSLYLRGAKIKLPDGANTDIIVGENFAALTTTDTTGGIHNFGIHGPGEIDGNKANQTIPVPTVAQSNFNLSANFTLTLSDTSGLPDTGTATVATLSGPNTFSWTANNKTTNTLTCTSGDGGRVSINEKIFTSGYGIRVYGYNFTMGTRLLVHDCVADGIWTEWGAGNVGSGGEMEATIIDGKTYNNGRTGLNFLGPHDATIDTWMSYRNGRAGFCTSGYATVVFDKCHGWGWPQIVSFEDHSSAQFNNCVGEVTATTNGRGFALYASYATVSACRVLWSGTGSSNAGIEILNNAAGMDIDAVFNGGAFPGGAVKFTLSGGGNRIRGLVNDGAALPLTTGTAHATDSIDLRPGTGTTSARVLTGFDTKPGPSEIDFKAYTYDPAVCVSSTALVSGQVNVLRVKAAAGGSASSLGVYVGTAGSGLTSGQCLLGLYDSTGALLATSSDQSGAWTSTGYKSAGVTGVTLTPGAVYYIAVLAVGTTPPGLTRTYSGGATNNAGNAGFVAAPFRYSYAGTGQTALPASLTLGTMTAGGVAYWAGIA